MGDLRSSLSNEQRNKLRNELSASVKKERPDVAGIERNAHLSTYRSGAQDDVTRLKQFLKQYEPVRKLYFDFQKENTRLQNNIELTATSKGNFADHFFTALGGFVIGIVLGFLAIFVTSSALMVIIMPFACAYLAVFLKDGSKDKAILKIQELILQRTEEFAAKLKPIYEKTNKAVAFPYASPYIVDKLIEYIENGRCDTIKECINLYEQEKAQYEQLKVLKQINMNATNTAAAASYLAYDTMVKNFFG